MRRILHLLPPGTIAVGSGLALLGVASYVHLGVAGRLLSDENYSSLSVLWSIVFTVGLGLFMPIEQETARVIAARRSAGLPAGPVLARGVAVAAVLLAVLVAVLLVTAPVIADRLFDGDVGLVWVLAGALVGLAVAYPTRGVLSGLQLFPWYGAQIGIDGALRIALVGALGLAGVSSPIWYGLVLLIAPVLAVAVTAPPVLRVVGGGVPVPWRPLLRGLGLLALSSLLAQVVVNIGVINVKLLAPGEPAIAGALLSAIVLVRIPLFVFASLQASLLPGLSASVATGDRTLFQDLLRRALTVVTVLGLGGGVVATLLGPWLVPLLFDAPDILTRTDFAWLSVGTLAYLWAMVLGQAVLAQERHRAQALGWLAGTVALIAVTLVPMPVTQRVEIAYAVGSLVIAAGLLALVYRVPQSATMTATPEALTPPVPGGMT